MNVLHVTPAFYPAVFWGGPIWSTKAICDGIAAREDMSLRVLTTDSAGLAVSQRVTSTDLPYPVQYARRVAGHSVAPALLAHLPAAMRWADVVHLTAVYNMPTLPVFALARLLDKPLIWSPRGALQATQDWSATPKRRAKLGFGRLLAAIAPQQMTMHATSPQEAAAGRQHFPAVPSQIIANAVDVPLHHEQTPRPEGKTRLIFLGRLHPKKGVHALIAALGALPASFTLDIYGRGEADYETKLRRLASGLADRVRFHGHVDASEKQAAFARADVFVLPSRSENFGIAIAEAMAHGLPVLTTQATPWQGLEAERCGRCIDLERTDLAAEIYEIAMGDLAAMGARGRAWMGRDFSTAAMVARFDALYRSQFEAAPREVYA